MPFSTNADPDQLATLGRIIDSFSSEHRDGANVDREHVAVLLLSIFSRGVTDPDELRAQLDAAVERQSAGPRFLGAARARTTGTTNRER